jgi:hypothetical protein
MFLIMNYTNTPYFASRAFTILFSRGLHAFRVEIWQCSARGDRVNRDVMGDVTPDALSCVLTPPVDTGS